MSERVRRTDLAQEEVLPALVKLLPRVDVALVLPDEDCESGEVLYVAEEDLGLSVALLDEPVRRVCLQAENKLTVSTDKRRIFINSTHPSVKLPS